MTSAVQYAFHMCFTSFHCTGRQQLNKLTSLPMCGFTVQLVEHRTGVAEVTGSDPVEALIFFRLLLSNYLNWKFTAMITLHFLEYFVVGMLHIALSLIDALISFSGRINAQNHLKSPDQNQHPKSPDNAT